MFLAAGVLGGSALVAAALVVILGIAGITWVLLPREGVQPTPVAPVVVAPAAPPPPLPVAAPVPVPVPVPVPAPVAAPRAVPVAEPEPAPEPLPAPQPAVARSGRVAVSGDASEVVFKSAAGSFPAGELPPGSYGIEASFGGALAPAGRIVIPEGGSVAVRCVASFKRCMAQ